MYYQFTQKVQNELRTQYTHDTLYNKVVGQVQVVINRGNITMTTTTHQDKHTHTLK